MLKLLLSILLFVSIPLTSFAQDYRQMFPEGVFELYQRGKFDSAIFLVKRDLEKLDRVKRAQSLSILGKLYRHNQNFDKSEEFYNQAIALSDSGSSEFGMSLIGLAHICIRRFELHKAREFLTTASFVVNQGEKRLKPYLMLSNLKLLAVENSPEYHQVFNEIVRLLPSNHPVLLEAYLFYADALIGDSLLTKAQAVLLESRKVVEESFQDNLPLTMRFYLTKSYFYYSSARSQDAIDLVYNEILPILKNHKDNWAQYLLADTYRLLGWYFEGLGNYYQALDCSINYIDIIRNFHDASFHAIGRVLGDISQLYSRLGNFELAKEYKRRAIRVNKNQKSRSFRLRALWDEADLHYAAGNWLDCLETLQQLFGLVPSNSYYNFSVFYLKAQVFYKKKQYDSTFYYVEKGAAFLRSRFGENDTRIYSLKQINQKALYDSGNKIAANDEYLKILRDIGDDPIDLQYQKALIALDYLSYQVRDFQGQDLDDLFALLFALQKDFAVNDLTKGKPLENMLINTKSVFSEYHMQAFIQRRDVSNLRIAHKHLKEFTSILVERAKLFQSRQDRNKELVRESYLFDNYLEACFRMFAETDQRQYLNEIFDVLERSRSNQLLTSLNRNIAIQNTGVPDSLVLQVNGLKQQEAFLNTQITKLTSLKSLSVLDSTKLSEFNYALTNNEAKFSRLMHHLEEQYPNYFEANYNQSLLSLDEVQQLLKPDEALIEYSVGKDNNYVLTLTRDTAYVHELKDLQPEDATKFKALIDLSREAGVYEGNYDTYVTQSKNLYQKLLAQPLAALQEAGVGINKLYIIPDEYLNYVPFDILIETPEGSNDGPEFGQLDYLIRKYNVSYGLSANVLFRKKQGAARKERSSKLLAIAPSYNELLNDESKLSQLGKFREGFSELLYNKSEVEGINEYFSTTTLKNEEATEQSFKEQIKDHQIVHLAMHALVDEEEPMRSKLVFSPIDEVDSLNDNYLHNFELFNMNLDIELAVLSACNTGDGEIEKGEGVMSLGRAFTYAGARSVVMSHWKVDDQAASVIMKSFYKYLSQGKKKDEALRSAKLDYLDTGNPQKQHPFYWSNFMLIGNTAPVSINEDWRQQWWVILLGSLSLFGFVFLMVKKRQRSTVGS